MKEIKEKPSERMPKEKIAGGIPNVALKKAWTEAKEKRNIPVEKQDGSGEQGAYAEADQAGGNIADGTTVAVSRNLDFSYRQGRQLTQKQYEKCKQQHSAEQATEVRAHTATERRVGPETNVGASGPMLVAHRSMGRICPVSAQEKKPPPSRLHRTRFVV